MAVRTWVGHFGIVRGQAQEMGPWQGVFTRRAPGEEPAQLYVLVHPALPGSEEFCGQMVAVIGRLFERQQLSLTGALVKAISAAHDNLRDWNRRSLREHQVGAGLSCLVVQGTLAYLAQAGPSLAYHRGDGVFRQLVPQDPAATAVVGLAEELRPELSRFELSPGALVLVVSPGLSEIADEEALAALLAGDGEQALSEVYLLTRDEQDFSAFLLSCYEEPEAAAPEPAPDEEETAADEYETPGVAPVEEEEPPPEQATIAEEPPPAPLEEADGAPPPGEDDEGDRLFAPMDPEAAGAPSTDITRRAVRLRSSQPSLRRYGRTTTAGRPSSLPWRAIAAVLFLGMAAFLAWCFIPGSLEENQEQKFTSLLTDARNSYSEALDSSDAAAKRAGLERADALLVDAAEIRPDDGELAGLRLQVSQALAELDAVYEMTDLQLLADLRTQVTGDISLQRLVVGGGAAYLLDRKGGRVIALPLGQPGARADVILSEGDLVGVLEAGRPIQMTWAPDVDGGRLLVLDSERNLFSFDPAKGTGLVTLRGADGWESVDGLASYNGNLYVLDTQGNQVWRYLPTEGGFDSERTGLLSGADLEGAVGLSVGGDIYLLMDKGGIRRFSGGEEIPFEMEGIDQPLVSPASPVLLAAGQLLVVDRGNKRIVAFSLNGRFQRQLVSGKFTDLQAVDVDEVAARIYILDGDSLYDAPLPSLGQESQPPVEEAPPAADTPSSDQETATPLPP